MRRPAVGQLPPSASRCAAASKGSPPPPTESLFDDSLFAAPARPVDAGEVFALSEPMQRYLEQELARDVRRKGPRAALVDALYAPGRLRLDYDAQRTRNAAEAFEARSGNCLSLVIMSAALARQLGLPVQFHSVHSDAGWGRSGDLLVSSGHVNLVLRHPSGDARTRFDVVEAMLIDFEPPRPGEKQYSRSISESTVLAMYMNNRAAESLAAGEVDEAYWFARAAIESEPTFLAAHNTLAVVYLRHGQPQRAERVLQRLLAAEPANTAALANLARLYEKQGRTPEAAAVQQRLARIEPVLRCFAENVFHMGPPGAGHTIKLLNNFVAQAICTATAEAFAVGAKAGADLRQLVKVISAGGVNSGLFQAMAKTLDGDFTGLTFELDNNSFVKLSLKHLDDHTPTFMPTPVRFVDGTIRTLPGLDPRRAAFYDVAWPMDNTLTNANGRTTSNIRDGLSASSDGFGLEADLAAGGGWRLHNKFSWVKNSGRFIGIFPGDDVSAAPAGTTIASGAGAGSAYSGNKFTAVIFNTQVDDAGLMANDLKLSRDFPLAGGKINAVAGLYHSVQQLDLTWNFNQYSLSARESGAQLLNVPGTVNGSPGFGGCSNPLVICSGGGGATPADAAAARATDCGTRLPVG